MGVGADSSLRVLHAVATENFAGVERYICYVAPELARRGLDVVVLGGDEQRMLPVLAETGVQHRRSASLAGILRSLLAERRSDVIHAHMTSAETAAAICKPILRSGLVVTRHFAASRGSSSIARAVGRAVAGRIDRQIAVTEYVAGHVEGPSDIVLSGVPRAEAGSHAEPVVLVAQRMEPEKDGSLALRAWALSGLADQGWRLVFAGDGAERNRLAGLASQYDVTDSVCFLGFVNDVPALMSRSSVLLASAPAEPFGLSVVEAMSRGLPVVAAAGGGHLETVGAVSPETTFPPGDADAAAHLLRRLGSDHVLRNQIGGRVLDFQRRELTVEGHVDRLVQVYASVAATKGARSSENLGTCGRASRRTWR